MNELGVPWETVAIVVALVAGIKRHAPSVKGWKTIVLAAVASILLCYDYAIPKWLLPIQTGLKVLAMAIGGHAYLRRMTGRVFPDRPSTSKSQIQETPPKSSERETPNPNDTPETT